MKKIIITMIAIVSILSVAIYAQNGKVSVNDENHVKLEILAEQGDTAAMHRLIEFYDENSTVYVEVEAVFEPDGSEWTAAKVDSLNFANRNNADMTKYYSNRLDYWLEKGVAMNDPVAFATKGMRLYHKDDENAIYYLS